MLSKNSMQLHHNFHKSLIISLALLCVSLGSVFGKQKPNIVFVVADDFGYHDIGYHGSEIKTPNLDKLASDGVKLENYYVQPICSPTRSQLMTGRYQIHTGLQHSIIWSSQPYGVPLKFPTIADILKQGGYSTHAVGKWHLGLFKKEYTPRYRGFDTYYGYLESVEDYFTYYNCDGEHKPPGHESKKTCPPDDTMCKTLPEELPTKWCGYDLRDNEDIVTTANGTYSTHLYTEKAKVAINAAKQSGKPLFLYLAYQAVHAPLEAPPEYIKPYSFIKDKNRRIYAGMTAALDEGMGNLTQALKNAGLWDNTILIFSTDNGGQIHKGGNNWPLRGFKTTLWEGGMRGVGFVTGPLVERQGTVSNEMMHVSDWFPTIAAMTDTKLNESLKLDGYDQSKMLQKGQKSKRTQILHNIDILTHHVGTRLFNNTFDTRVRAAVRVGDYKLITGSPGDGHWYPPPHMKGSNSSLESVALEDERKNLWLFNVKKDPNEVTDLSTAMPEKVLELLDVLTAYNKTAVPPVYPPSDPKCDPRLHGGFWGPWQ